jgi:type II secretory pathway pseudopilin PulG
MFCSKCGEHIDDETAVCPLCGSTSPVLAQSMPPPAAASPAPPLAPGFGPTSMAVKPQTDGKAVWSLVLGIISLLCGILPGIVAIILGHMSRSSIRQGMGRLKGDGMATAGLVMGYISIAAIPLVLIVASVAIPRLLKAKISANDSAAAATVRALDTAQRTYSIIYPSQHYATNLEALGPGDSGSCAGSGTSAHACLIDDSLGCTGNRWCTQEGFAYYLRTVGSPPTDYVITATPMSLNTGDKSFCSTSDMRVRHKAGAVRKAPTVAECQSWEAL